MSRARGRRETRNESTIFEAFPISIYPTRQELDEQWYEGKAEVVYHLLRLTGMSTRQICITLGYPVEVLLFNVGVHFEDELTQEMLIEKALLTLKDAADCDGTPFDKEDLLAKYHAGKPAQTVLPPADTRASRSRSPPAGAAEQKESSEEDQSPDVGSRFTYKGIRGEDCLDHNALKTKANGGANVTPGLYNPEDPIHRHVASELTFHTDVVKREMEQVFSYLLYSDKDVRIKDTVSAETRASRAHREDVDKDSTNLEKAFGVLSPFRVIMTKLRAAISASVNQVEEKARIMGRVANINNMDDTADPGIALTAQFNKINKQLAAVGAPSLTSFEELQASANSFGKSDNPIIKEVAAQLRAYKFDHYTSSNGAPRPGHEDRTCREFLSMVSATWFADSTYKPRERRQDPKPGKPPPQRRREERRGRNLGDDDALAMVAAGGDGGNRGCGGREDEQ